ncbi:MAG: isocitrate lyase/phosphoenolpyruvate mutase family protein [Gaiellaceae bacterium]
MAVILRQRYRFPFGAWASNRQNPLEGIAMRLLVTGGTGVLGRAFRPHAEAAGHELVMPAHDELDLFDRVAVADAVHGVEGVVHLATRIRTLDQISDRDAWRENDRLRADASRILVDAAIAGGASVYIQPTVTFVYPPRGRVSEDTPVADVLALLESALAAEEQAERFARSGGRGVVLRMGMLDGDGTWFDRPMGDFGATLHVSDAARALVSALSLPSGIYNVCRDGERVSNERFARSAGWRPPAVNAPDLRSRCDLLRSLHRRGEPLLLPNAWDAATARAVEAAGFPAVATTSGGVAASLGYLDLEDAPADEMLAAAARIARSVDVPVTVDAEAGYGMEPTELVAALRAAGAAGCNLEDSDYAAGRLRDPQRHAEWLRTVRTAATEADYPLVINARIDVFLPGFIGGAEPGTQQQLVREAVRRARAYLEAGADCVYPIALWEAEALGEFASQVRAPINVMRLPQAPSLAELAEIGIARVSWATLLYRDAMARFEAEVASLRE